MPWLTTIFPRQPSPLLFWKQREYRQKRLYRRLTLITISILGLLIVLFSLKFNLDNRRQAQTPLSHPYLIEFIFDPDTSQISVRRATPIRKLPNQKLNSTAQELTLIQPDGQSITYPFIWTTKIQADTFDQTNASYTLPNPIAVVIMSYSSQSTIFMPPPDSNTPQQVDTSAIIEPFVQPINTPLQNASPASQLHLAYIANGYTNFDQFHSDAAAMHQKLTSVYPFTIFTQQLIMHQIDNQIDLGCFRPTWIPRLIVCDRYLVELAAANTPADELIVIDNSNEYGGSGSPGLAVTYRDVSALAAQVMVHEFGHSFGSLQDEYNLDSTYSGIPPWPNCSAEPTCAQWSAVAAAGCIPGCGYTNLYRPTQNDSLMRTLTPNNGFRFGPVSEEHLYKLLALHTGNVNTDPDQDEDTDYLDLIPTLTTYDQQQLYLTGDIDFNGSVTIIDFNHLLKGFKIGS